jgi:hypothetical protein
MGMWCFHDVRNRFLFLFVFKDTVSIADYMASVAGLRENLPQYNSVYQKSHITKPGLESGPQRWKAGD